MGKKIPILILTVTLLGSFTIPKSAFADEDGPWTFDEMNTLNQEVEALKDEQCKDSSDPFMCYRTFKWDGENRPKYETLTAFNENSFTITAINPNKNTIRVYYNSENVNGKHMGSHDYYSDVSELYIGQYRQGYSGDLSYSIKNNIEDPDLNILYFGARLFTSEGLIPSDIEIELPLVNQLSLSDDMDQRISVSYTNTNRASYSFSFNYSNCVNSPDYQEGMECQIRYFGFDQPPFYVPAMPREEPVSDTIDEQFATDDQNVLGVQSTQDVERTEGYGGSSDGSTANSSITIKTPYTGALTEECAKSVEFPWWLIALILLGNAAIIWWFIPARKRK